MSTRRGGGRPMAGRVVWSLIGGALLGVAVALLLQAAIQRTANPLPPQRAFWQLVLLGFGGSLVGFALSAVSALQAGNPDPEYHRPHQPLRPSSSGRGSRRD